MEQVTDSAPTSTADVAASVMEQFEQAESTPDTTPEVAAETPAVEAAPEPKAELSEEEQAIEALLAEFGFKEARKPDGREHYIPRSKVLKMIGSGLKRGQEKWTTERGVFESQMKELRAHLDGVRNDVLGDPRAFLQKLSTVDQRYAAFLQSQPAPQQPQPVTEMPQPDVPLADGSRTYSVEGLQNLIQWAVDAKLMPKVDERLKPLTEREQKLEVERQVERRISQQMETAKSWPNWTDYEADILKTLQADSAKARQEGRRPSMSLREAYLEVRAERLSTDEAKVREKVIADMQKAPKSTATPVAAPETPRPTGPVSTAQTAAKVLARLERGA